MPRSVQDLTVDAKLRTPNLVVERFNTSGTNPYSRNYRNVASFDFHGVATGAIVIQTRVKPATMVRMEIVSSQYQSAIADRLLDQLLFVYAQNLTTIPRSSVVQSGGRRPAVQAGYNAAGELAIILGTVADTWEYPRLHVPFINLSHTGASTDAGSGADGWVVTVETDLAPWTTLTALSDVTPGPVGAIASGDLSGSYPNPDIRAGVIVAADINAALKPSGSAAPATEALRAIGAGAGQVVAGNDLRLTDARAPSGGASGDLTGSYPSPTIAPLAVDSGKVATSLKNGADIAPTMRSLGYGAGEAMPGLPTTVVPFNSKRITDVADPTGAQDAATKAYVDAGVAAVRAPLTDLPAGVFPDGYRVTVRYTGTYSGFFGDFVYVSAYAPYPWVWCGGVGGFSADSVVEPRGVTTPNAYMLLDNIAITLPWQGNYECDIQSWITANSASISVRVRPFFNNIAGGSLATVDSVLGMPTSGVHYQWVQRQRIGSAPGTIVMAAATTTAVSLTFNRKQMMITPLSVAAN